MVEMKPRERMEVMMIMIDHEHGVAMEREKRS